MSLQCPSLFAEHASDLCRAIDHYCERTGPELDAELVNAFTNGAFLVGAVIAWRLLAQAPQSPTRPYIHVLIAAMAMVGIGSFIFHTLGTRWAEWADVIPILVFMLLYLWFILTHLFQWRTLSKVAALVVFFVATFLIEARVPGDVLCTHFLWHLLNATLLYLLVRLAILKVPGAAARSGPAIAA
jgi:ceramidase